jgi:hypothetical protein
MALFGPTPSAEGKISFADMEFGQRHPSLGRYKMPLLPGEAGTKAGGDWVPRGIQSATNLAGSISETRSLGIWERQRSQLGLALDPQLYERMAYLIRTALADGLDLNEKLSASELGKRVSAELELLHNEARERCGANMAATRGTALHNGWEHRAPIEIEPGMTLEAGSALFSDVPQEGAMFVALETLLKRAGLERVPGLQERVVRHVELKAAGRFDDILRTTRDIRWEQRLADGVSVFPVIPAGTMLMADLKTKRDRFWSWLEVRIQLAVYATAEWMLDLPPTPEVAREIGHCYVPGPKHHVSQQWGVVLHMPQDGAPPALKRVNIQAGLRAARLARAVCDERSEGKSVATHGEAEWPEQLSDAPEISST